ncbi:DUF6944 family repetitive protein [Alkalihalobacillus pseudalcaliphilus]|uniref:DUF6944 family repetitive protein n=1 Tax=Alkalihalobacillus pseudalcaliphilus TaxID=79884 RepID=UPI00064DD3BE|nr:hypothetical protein [Alkalihalobacillus pseudalcaliphilus]KMK74687.1 hypothetical protein AB990_19535 [Alkalihalobacillus pseudalcaliphilus]
MFDAIMAERIGAWVQTIGAFFTSLAVSLPEDGSKEAIRNTSMYGNLLQAFGVGLEALGVEEEELEANGQSPLFPNQLWNNSTINNEVAEEFIDGGIIEMAGLVFIAFSLDETLSDDEDFNNSLAVGGGVLQAIGAYLTLIAAEEEPYEMIMIGRFLLFIGASASAVGGLLGDVRALDIWGEYLQFIGALLVAIALSPPFDERFV